MRSTLTLDIEHPDDLAGVTIVDDLSEHVQSEFEGITVYGTTTASADLGFIVYGVVKGKPDERWAARVMAPSTDEAEQKAKDEAPDGTERTVAVVLPDLRGQGQLEERGV